MLDQHHEEEDQEARDLVVQTDVQGEKEADTGGVVLVLSQTVPFLGSVHGFFVTCGCFLWVSILTCNELSYPSCHPRFEACGAGSAPAVREVA